MKKQPRQRSRPSRYRRASSARVEPTWRRSTAHGHLNPHISRGSRFIHCTTSVHGFPQLGASVRASVVGNQAIRRPDVVRNLEIRKAPSYQDLPAPTVTETVLATGADWRTSINPEAPLFAVHRKIVRDVPVDGTGASLQDWRREAWDRAGANVSSLAALRPDEPQEHGSLR